MSPATRHRYAFVGNDPVNQTDVYGFKIEERAIGLLQPHKPKTSIIKYKDPFNVNTLFNLNTPTINNTVGNYNNTYGVKHIVDETKQGYVKATSNIIVEKIDKTGQDKTSQMLQRGINAFLNKGADPEYEAQIKEIQAKIEQKEYNNIQAIIKQNPDLANKQYCKGETVNCHGSLLSATTKQVCMVGRKDCYTFLINADYEQLEPCGRTTYPALMSKRACAAVVNDKTTFMAGVDVVIGAAAIGTCTLISGSTLTPVCLVATSAFAANEVVNFSEEVYTNATGKQIDVQSTVLEKLGIQTETSERISSVMDTVSDLGTRTIVIGGVISVSAPVVVSAVGVKTTQTVGTALSAYTIMNGTSELYNSYNQYKYCDTHYCSLDIYKSIDSNTVNGIFNTSSGAVGTYFSVKKIPELNPLKNNLDRIDYNNIKYSDTVMNHNFDVSLKTGMLARPYNNSTLVIKEIINSVNPIPDPKGIPNAFRWNVPGTMNGSVGMWELVINTDTNTIIHYNFVSSR